MKNLTRPLFRGTALVVAVAAVLLFAGCHRGRGRKGEAAYVSATQATLRDRVAAIYNKVATVKNAERVEILDRDRRFALVRTANGAQGWIEQRYLVTQKVFDGFQKLAQDEKNGPVQATVVTRNESNLHLEPGRDTEHLYQIAQGAKLSVLKRSTSEKRLPGVTKASAPDAPKPLEDWWLARDADGHVGWVLARMVDVDIPLEIAQYAEGQRIIAAFVLNEVQDANQKVAQYLVLMTEPKDGMDFDYNQARVFSWNVKRHRYETAYRERLSGILPVTVSKETFEKEGELPVFVLLAKSDSGDTVERKYKFNSPIVKRVEQPSGKAAGAAPSSNKKH